MPENHIHHNQLLLALQKSVIRRWQKNLELIELTAGLVLINGCDSIHSVYFPLDCMVSLLNMPASGRSSEVAKIGSDGVVGLSLSAGQPANFYQAIVQSGGKAYRLPKELIHQEINDSFELLYVFLRFHHRLVSQMTQTALCNQHHSKLQQLCRWLLLGFDCLDSREMQIQSDLMARLVGMPNKTMMDSIAGLQNQGLINYNQQKLFLIDRPQLLQCSCACYLAIKKEDRQQRA